jgi:hypothetical protein
MTTTPEKFPCAMTGSFACSMYAEASKKCGGLREPKQPSDLSYPLPKKQTPHMTSVLWSLLPTNISEDKMRTINKTARFEVVYDIEVDTLEALEWVIKDIEKDASFGCHGAGVMPSGKFEGYSYQRKRGSKFLSFESKVVKPQDEICTKHRSKLRKKPC